MFLFVLGLFSCEKESVLPSTDSNLKASMNDENWVSTTTWATYSKKEQKFYINASKHNSKYSQEEELSMSFEMKDLTQPTVINQFSSEWVYIIGGDAIADRYELDPSDINEIRITSINTTKRQIAGTFSIRLARDERFVFKSNTFHLTKGHFSVTYSEIE